MAADWFERLIAIFAPRWALSRSRARIEFARVRLRNGRKGAASGESQGSEPERARLKRGRFILSTGALDSGVLSSDPPAAGNVIAS